MTLDEENSTPTAAAAEQAGTQAAKRPRRRAASRPAGPPTATEPSDAPADAPAAARADAPAAARADAPTQASMKAPADAEPAAAAPRKRASRKKAAPSGAAVVLEPAEPGAPAAVPTTTTEPAQQPPDVEAPPKTTRRRRAKAAAAPQAPADIVGGEADASATPAPQPAEQQPEQPEQPAAGSRGAGPLATTMLLFQPPQPTAEPGTRRRRAASRPAGPPQHEEPAAPAPDEDEDAGATLTAATEQAAAGVEQVTEAPEDAEHIGEDDEAAGDTPRRRRRRGGRGRRGRSRAEGDQGEGDEADAAAGAPADDEAAEAAGEVEDEDDEADESGTGSSRRRRRRRRRGAGGADDAAEEPGTVTRVREARRRSSGDNGGGDVTGLRGSTRLEAKKQRRREGREAGRRRPVITEAEFLARRESVDRVMVVRERDGRTQIGVLEDEVLVEHYVARRSQTSMVGNVYLGKVQNVLPSMEAAFVDIGKGRNAVLYAGEVNWDAAGLEGQPKRIEHALKAGESVLVQVTKDPIGHKGARLTSQISLPGRYLVFVPDGSMTGISRKLPDNERNRLKKALRQIVPDDAGVIVRTAAEGASEAALERDVARLQAQWEDISRKAGAVNAPALLYGEPDLAIRVVRDIFNEDFARLVVDGVDAWETLQAYIGHVAPDLAERLERWDGDADVFSAHRIDEQLAKALDRKVFLPSGGSLVIDRTEAMTVVDVNTGKFTGSGGNLEETVTKNNLEAAEEVVRQLRLRDIGGIIVVDFIDMVLESNRELVLRRLLECLGRDRTKHQVAEVTSLGLVQMTRKRVGQGLLEVFSDTCEHCGGRGLIIHDEPVEKRPQDSPGRSASSGGRSRGGRGGANNNANNSGGSRNAARETASKQVAEPAGPPVQDAPGESVDQPVAEPVAGHA